MSNPGYGPGTPSNYQDPYAAYTQPPAPNKTNKTLVIALVVGAILIVGFFFCGILAAVAVPGFLEAQIRSKTSRTRADMRSMATAIEAYYVDNNLYPASTTDPALSVLPNQPIWRFSTFRAGNDDLNALTEPISYITTYLPDPFADVSGNTYYYYSNGKWWVMWSPGPDGDYDLDPAAMPFNIDRWGNLPEEILDCTYDPTNGTVSDGDIWRMRM